MKRSFKTCGGLLAALAVVPAANAEVTFNGFGQVVVGKTLDDALVKGSTYTSDVSFDNESLLALQATAPVSDRMDVVAQIVARARDDFDPDFAWAYVRYRLDSNWSVKAGRQRIPYFRDSEYLEVGAAYPYMRPPMSVYNIPFSDYDGVNLLGSHSFGAWELESQLVYGAVDKVLDDGTSLTLDDLYVAAVEAKYDGWLSLRASHSCNDSSMTMPALQPFFDMLIQAGQPGIAADLAMERDTGCFSGVGAGVEQGRFVMGAEYTKLTIDDSFLNQTDSYYVSLGYRLGKFTPMLVFGDSEFKGNDSVLNGLDPSDPIYAMVAGFASGAVTEDSYWNVSSRYDLGPSLAVKFDFTRYETNMPGTEDSDLFSAGLVFTF